MGHVCDDANPSGCIDGDRYCPTLEALLPGMDKGIRKRPTTPTDPGDLDRLAEKLYHERYDSDTSRCCSPLLLP